MSCGGCDVYKNRVKKRHLLCERLGESADSKKIGHFRTTIKKSFKLFFLRSPRDEVAIQKNMPPSPGNATPMIFFF